MFSAERATAWWHVFVRHLSLGVCLGENHRRPSRCTPQIRPNAPSSSPYCGHPADRKSVAQRPPESGCVILVPMLPVQDLGARTGHVAGYWQQRYPSHQMAVEGTFQYSAAFLAGLKVALQGTFQYYVALFRWPTGCPCIMKYLPKCGCSTVG